jgi:hypothetical protein
MEFLYYCYEKIRTKYFTNKKMILVQNYLSISVLYWTPSNLTLLIWE